MELRERLEELHRLKERASRSDKIAKERKQRAKDAEIDLFHYMQRNGLDAVAAGGHMFAPRSTTLGVVNDQAAFEQWLMENDLYDEYIRTEPQKARLNEMIRERIDNQQELPPGTNAYAKEYISITER